MILLIDNYDSFTYNLVQYFGELGEDVRVARNDEITLDEIERLAPARICISPMHADRTKMTVRVCKRRSKVTPTRFNCCGAISSVSLTTIG